MMRIVEFLLVTHVGLHVCVGDLLASNALTSSDCFVDYFRPIEKYTNIFNKEIFRYEVKNKCEDKANLTGETENAGLNNIAKNANKNNKSAGKCHMISRPQLNGFCRLNEDPLHYEYPKLDRREPGIVGDVQKIALKPGMVHDLVTKAVNPPVFEIPSFLTSKECDYIITKAKDNGMVVSGVVGEDINDQLKSNKSLADVDRVSQTSFLWKYQIGVKFWLKLRKRISKLTLLPLIAVKQSEVIQVAQYLPGGHYHAHLDSTALNYSLPCCFQSPHCLPLTHTPQWDTCCRFCRFITVMIYLNDTEEGGQTAFPFADLDDSTVEEKIAKGNWSNLSRTCNQASLLVTPEKGKAVFWYNHEVNETGYLGKSITQSYHGGCDVIKGSKWIANFWLLWPTYEDRSKKSRFNLEATDMPLSYR